MALVLAVSLALLAPISRLASWLIAVREIKSFNDFCFEVQSGKIIRYFGLLSGFSQDNEMHLLRKNLNFLGRLHSLKNELKNTETALDLVEKLAVTDQLTGLYNRRFFDEQLRKCAEQVQFYDGELYFLLIDADHFKQVNDTLGHQAGDKLLADLGILIKNSIRVSSDFPCRIGGDEFCVIFTNINFNQINEVAERIRIKFSEISVGGATLSMGISQYHCRTGDAEDISKMIHLADEAVYTAKRYGGNRIECKCA